MKKAPSESSFVHRVGESSGGQNRAARRLTSPLSTDHGSMGVATDLIVQALLRLEQQEDGDRVQPSGEILEVRSARFKCVVTRASDLRKRGVILSKREFQIAVLVGKGGSTKTIASELSIRVPTVNSYIRRIFSKMSVSSRAAMVSRLPDAEVRTRAIEPREGEDPLARPRR